MPNSDPDRILSDRAELYGLSLALDVARLETKAGRIDRAVPIMTWAANALEIIVAKMDAMAKTNLFGEHPFIYPMARALREKSNLPK